MSGSSRRVADEIPGATHERVVWRARPRGGDGHAQRVAAAHAPGWSFGVARGGCRAGAPDRGAQRDALDYAVDDAVGDQFPDERYVTAVIAQLDLKAGRLSWIAPGIRHR